MPRPLTAARIGTAVAAVVFLLLATGGQPWDLFERGPFTSDFYDVQARALSRAPRRARRRGGDRGLRGRRRDAPVLRVRTRARPAADRRRDRRGRRPPGGGQPARRARRGVPGRCPPAAAGAPRPRHRRPRAVVAVGDRRLRCSDRPVHPAAVALVAGHHLPRGRALGCGTGAARVRPHHRVVGVETDRGPRCGRPSSLRSALSTRGSSGIGPALALGGLAVVLAVPPAMAGGRADGGRRGRPRAALRLGQRGPLRLRRSACPSTSRCSTTSPPSDGPPSPPTTARCSASSSSRPRRCSTCGRTRSKPRALAPWFSWGGRADVVGDVTFDTVDRSASLPVTAPRSLVAATVGVVALVRRRLPAAWPISSPPRPWRRCRRCRSPSSPTATWPTSYRCLSSAPPSASRWSPRGALARRAARLAITVAAIGLVAVGLSSTPGWRCSADSSTSSQIRASGRLRGRAVPAPRHARRRATTVLSSSRRTRRGRRRWHGRHPRRLPRPVPQ